MKYILLIICSCLFFSCSDAFINHKLKYERVGDCVVGLESIKMISNINGERYEFYSCIDDGFDGKNYQVERTGDSISVSFPKTESQKRTQFKLTLDIDAKPRYSVIIIDGREINIVPAEK